MLAGALGRGDLAGTRQSPRGPRGPPQKMKYDLGAGEPKAAETTGPPGSTYFENNSSFPSPGVTWSESLCHMISDAHEQKVFSSFK